ncbi:conserved hypothetical protein [Vibrio owensii]|uniref:Uncharacterized protein n=1 Tax=Vibrio owensii TaxID=696485 RepID=A0AAU9QDK7_9VIBR|nr:conserved hypothetical protein [Vibrio owensii]CAH1566071.1 conserved hypothetical protein [Vibrio owensii]CAH1600510.1 conserved hypothetical protein [Vibrio owensii]
MLFFRPQFGLYGAVSQSELNENKGNGEPSFQGCSLLYFEK